MRAFITLLVLALALAAPAWADEFFPLDQVVPGLKGKGRTVFSGSRIEEFDVQILGLLRNIAPGQNAILARLSGAPLEETGVFQGMSGSPVYIDGKLVGAIAFAVPFSKAAIAGITPIGEMVELFEQSPLQFKIERRSVRPISLKQLIERRLAPLERPEAGVAEFEIPALLAPAPWLVGQRLARIATPVVFSGFDPRAIELFAPTLRSLGLAPVIGGAAGKQTEAARPEVQPELRPGDTISVQLVRGDYDISASGTVTYVQGDRVYAFGHPFLGMGFTQLPLNRAEVLAIIPSLASSQKVSVTAEPIGTIEQDRATGIYGLIGKQPRMIPVNIALNTSRNRSKVYSYEIVNDPFLTPLLVNLTVLSTIFSSERALGYSTLQLRGEIAIKGHQAIRIEESFSAGINSPMAASLAVAAPIGFLLSSGFDNLEFESVDLEITSHEEDKQVVLDRVWIDRTKAAPGEEVNVTLFLKRGNGEEIVQSYPIKIPDNLSAGPLSILIADGESLMRADAREMPYSFIPESLNQLIRLINELKKNDRLYLRLYRRERGAVIKGEGLPGLPPSVISILESPRTVGGSQPINLAVYAEHELAPMDFVVSGQKTIEIEVAGR